MKAARMERRLSAIVAADVVGYSRLMGLDEEGTLRRVKALRREVMDPCVANKHGRVVKTTGDGFLVEFGSVVDAFQCALSVQNHLRERSSGVASDQQLALRIGINVGDVIRDDGDVFGDGVNVAARLEPLAPVGGICVSRRAWEDLRRLGLPFEDMGEQQLKNISEPIRAYQLTADQIAAIPAEAEPDDDPQLAKAARPKRRLGLPVAALVAVGVAAGGWFSLTGRNSGEGIQANVRLGSFAAISPDVPKGLSEALRQELMAAFSIENAVTVVMSGDTKAAKASPFLIDGSVREIDRLLRFTMNFKNDRTGVLLWSQTFDVPRAAEKLAPRQVAVSASQIVRCALWGASAHSTTLTDKALSLYLQFCNEFWGGSSTEDRMLDAARRVTDAAPNFSFGWSARALTALPLTRREGFLDVDELRREAAFAARKALEIEPQNPEGYMVQAGLLPLRAYPQREALLNKAISVRPTECGCERQLYGDFLVSVGRLDEAVDQFQRGHDMQPLAPRSNVRLVHALYSVGKIDEADRQLGKILEVWPYAASLQVLQIKSALWTRRYPEALKRLRDPGLHLDSSSRDALIATFEALESGDPGQRARTIELLKGLSADRRKNDRLVVSALAALGASTDAIDAAARLIQNNSIWLADVLFEPNLAAVASDPAYAKLVTQIGLTDYWRATGQAPDICNKPKAPAFCGTM